MIEIKNLKKSFGTREVLKDIDIKINDGEVVSVIGGSGSGKSTFIKCIVRLLNPDSGSILLDGKDIAAIKDDFALAEVRKNFGYLFQEGALFDSMNVGQNVAFGLKYLTDTPRADYAKIVKEKLALVGLKDIEDLKPSELSGGMKKRVSLARVLATNPKYILYDEPTSGLDPIMSDIISELVLDLKKKLNITSIVITHDMKSAYKISDKIAFLYQGKFVLVGTPDEFKQSDNEYVKQFVNGSAKGPIQMQIKRS
ncbi:phospholipid/cholesterol/gamma-HCH transport system ATP-binding protein [Parelusimicrobium proximum]|uniref:ABC transporter ATP-binding protein n=1 Tax=Parelusimicrobium proximum TaxID=3228953 RepID=UPI003D17D37E